MASTKPRATASPSPTPAWPVRSPRRWNGWNTRSRSVGPDARAPVDRPAGRRGRPPRRASTAHRRRRGRERTALATMLATARSSSAGSACTGGSVSGTCDHDGRRCARRGWPAPRPRPPPGTPAGARPRTAPALQPAHVEQVAHEAVEPVGLLVDGREELVALVVGDQSTSVCSRLVTDALIDAAACAGRGTPPAGARCAGRRPRPAWPPRRPRPAGRGARRASGELGGEGAQHALVVAGESAGRGGTSTRVGVERRDRRRCRRPASAGDAARRCRPPTVQAPSVRESTATASRPKRGPQPLEEPRQRILLAHAMRRRGGAAPAASASAWARDGFAPRGRRCGRPAR